jgi:hypothetical protein
VKARTESSMHRLRTTVGGRLHKFVMNFVSSMRLYLFKKRLRKIGINYDQLLRDWTEGPKMSNGIKLKVDLKSFEYRSSECCPEKKPYFGS